VSGKNFFLRHLWAPTFEWLLLSGNRNILIAEMTSFVPVDDHSLKTIYYLSLPLFILFLMLQHSSPSLLLCVFTYSRERIKKKKSDFSHISQDACGSLLQNAYNSCNEKTLSPLYFSGQILQNACAHFWLPLSFFFY
jgi:hypothetical protein